MVRINTKTKLFVPTTWGHLSNHTITLNVNKHGKFLDNPSI